jgi:hypothetical protein
VLCPVHATRDEFEGGGVHHMNGHFETVRHLFAARAACPKPRMHVAQMFQRLPEEGLGDGGRSQTVGMAEVVARWRRGGANGAEWAGVQAQRIAHIIEADGVAELRIHQSYCLAPIAEATRLGSFGMLTHERWQQMRRNEVAELA